MPADPAPERIRAEALREARAECQRLRDYYAMCGLERRNSGRPDNYEAGEWSAADACARAIDALSPTPSPLAASADAARLLGEAAQACADAYHHLNRFGVMSGGTQAEWDSQLRVFDALRPFVSGDKRKAIDALLSSAAQGGGG